MPWSRQQTCHGASELCEPNLNVAVTEQRDTSATDIAVRRGNVAEGALGLNLVAQPPRKRAGEIAADYKTRKEVDTRRKAFMRKWRVKCEPL
jgi:hypothetical protein